MADGSGRSEAFGQLVLKAGVPLAVAALAALFYVRKSSSVQALDKDDYGVESTDKENDAVDEVRNGVVLGLVDRIKELHAKEEELEARFERYQCMKECEGMVLELKNMLHLEMVRGDYLEKEVSSIESEARRVQELEICGLKLFQEVKNLKRENARLKKRVKKYLRKSMEGIRVIGAQKLRIRDLDAMITRSREEVEKATNVVHKMAEEIAELHCVVDELRREKMELSDKLEEGEIVTMDKHKHNINELEKLQKEFTAEVSELACLRQTNAFLRRQLMQCDERGVNDLGLMAGGSGGEPEQAVLELDLHHELGKIEMERENSSPEVKTIRKRSVMKTLKKWVEGRHHTKSKIAAI